MDGQHAERKKFCGDSHEGEFKDVLTPMEVGSKLSLEDASPLVVETLYTRLVGSLIFLCNITQYISFAFGVLSKFSNQPRENHWKARMLVLCYAMSVGHWHHLHYRQNNLWVL